jgi:hypothetical protein
MRRFKLTSGVLYTKEGVHAVLHRWYRTRSNEIRVALRHAYYMELYLGRVIDVEEGGKQASKLSSVHS